MAAKLAYFITGTDTEIGKTLISSALLHVLVQQGFRAAGMKPVAAGGELRDGVWHNEDMDKLAAAANVSLPQAISMPYLLKASAAPHIVAAHEGVSIDLAHIKSCYDRVVEVADAVIVEGVGGFRVPLSRRYDMSDVARQLGLPVIMVVGVRLGCLNHALLTADAIAARGLVLSGWVANVVDEAMLYSKDNVEALTARLPAPLLGCVPRLTVPLPAAAASYLDFSPLPGWQQVTRPV